MAAAALAMVPAKASAQTQFSGTCGVSGGATAPATINYDPFSPSGLSQVSIPLVLQRTRTLLFGRTDEVSLVLVAPAGSPPLQVTYQGQNVLYQEGSVAGRPRSVDSRDGGAGSAGEIRYRYGGLFASDFSPALNLTLSIAPGANLANGEPIYLDLLYICSGEGTMLSNFLPTRVGRAVRVDVTAVSALQAYYAGSALDFGELGGVSTAQVVASPDRYATPATNSLRVRSSGPYEVRVASQNNFRLTAPGGNLANPAETIAYQVSFLGREISATAPFGTRTCTAAGVTGTAGLLPLRARLLEGGSTKMPSSNYADRITVTFTPLVAASSAQSCAGL
jgi:spore coat protein U-like protein